MATPIRRTYTKPEELIEPRQLARTVQASLQDDEWRSYLTIFIDEAAPAFNLHLAIFVEPYLSFILEGRKTVESRFSVTRRAPYNKVTAGDVILLKRSGGPIVGLCKAQHAWYYELNAETWTLIRERFGRAICAPGEAFWETRKRACYATLIRVTRATSLSPILFKKRDRRGWVTLNVASPEAINS